VRPAAEFVQKAKQFKSKIKISNCSVDSGPPVNAKSIVSVLTQCLSTGVIAEISAEGEDEREAVVALVTLINAGFDE